jgi:uncharacterized protein YaaN involved in tellurite resistance
MSKLNIALLVLALASPAALAECVNPTVPTLPKGAKSTMDQMLEAQKAVKTFQTANIEYMNCLEKQFTAAEAATKEGSDADKKAAQTEYDKAIEAYNTAVSREEAVAGQFNAEIRDYKAATAK